MFKLCVFLAVLAVAFSAPAPEPKPGLLAAPVVAAAVPAPFVTAHSSQYIARNYNTFAAAPLAYAAAPVAYTAPAIAPAYAAHYVL